MWHGLHLLTDWFVINSGRDWPKRFLATVSYTVCIQPLWLASDSDLLPVNGISIFVLIVPVHQRVSYSSSFHCHLENQAVCWLEKQCLS